MGAEQLFATVLATRPGDPLITYYNDATGERIELSAKSLGNWVAKTHFLLLDELGLGPGDSARVDLPADWITVAILLGCWSAGLSVTTAGDAEVAFVSTAGGGSDTYAVNLASMTRAYSGAVPAGALDYVASVRPQPDAWGSVRFAAGPSDLAVDGLSRAALVAVAESRAVDLRLAGGARVLYEHPWTGPPEWIDALLAPMVVGGSLVLVANADPDPARRARRIEQEHVTVAL